MAKLIAKSPCSGLLPVEMGSVHLEEVETGRIWSVAPFKGQSEAVDKALTAIGLTFPGPNEVVEAEGARAIWAGRGTALVEAETLPDLAGIAAVTEQSDAWAVVCMTGENAEAVLARLVPIDLRRAQFSEGQTARTMVGHMMSSITCVGSDRFEIMVMRSMAGTLVHDLTRAAKLYAGRP